MLIILHKKLGYNMYKTISCFFFLVSFGLSHLFAEPISCSPQLRNCLNQIEKIPEARQLIEKIQQDGPFCIKVTDHNLGQQFGAFWDIDNREINVNVEGHRTEGEMIGSILFEMQNALASKKLDDLDRQAMKGQINRDKYVESVEYIEYVNSKNAARIANTGIQMGVLPRTSMLNTYPNFEEHFKWQKYGGHSAWIARTYDQLTSCKR